jgi:hypothetical protein
MRLAFVAVVGVYLFPPKHRHQAMDNNAANEKNHAGKDTTKAKIMIKTR